MPALSEPVTDTAEVEKLCDRWARWLRSGDNGAGGGGFKYEPPDVQGHDPVICDPTSEVMDRIIARLPKHMRRAVIARHYWQYSDRQAAIELHTNKTMYRAHVRFALQWMDGYISGITGSPVCEITGLEGIEPFIQAVT